MAKAETPPISQFWNCETPLNLGGVETMNRCDINYQRWITGTCENLFILFTKFDNTFLCNYNQIGNIVHWFSWWAMKSNPLGINNNEPILERVQRNWLMWLLNQEDLYWLKMNFIYFDLCYSSIFLPFLIKLLLVTQHTFHFMTN